MWRAWSWKELRAKSKERNYNTNRLLPAGGRPDHQIHQMRVRARTVEFGSAMLADVITSGKSAA